MPDSDTQQYWNGLLQAMGLALPESEVSALSGLANGAVGGLARYVATPGALAAPNPYPAGSEEADWYNRWRTGEGANWAAQTALSGVGAGSLFGPSEAGTVLGAGGGSNLAQLQKLLDELGTVGKGESTSAAALTPEAILDLSDKAIAAALKKNPGASIFDIASPASLVKPKLVSSSDSPFYLGSFSSAVPFAPSELALERNFLTPALHGTRVGESWRTPMGISLGEADKRGADALELPSDQLGVHFGNPAQAHHFSGNTVSDYDAPRTYPVVLQTGRSLELPDAGSWQVDRINDQLDKLDSGIGHGVSSGNFKVAEPFAHLGEFPANEREGIGNIQQMRSYLASKGYDSVNYINAVEDPGKRSYIMFKPSEDPKYVAGVRSRFAKFDPSALGRPELAAGLAAAAASPVLLDELGRPYVQTR